jgi:RNA chaperone Hfq
VKNPQHSIDLRSATFSEESVPPARKKAAILKLPRVRAKAQSGIRTHSLYGSVNPTTEAGFQEKHSEDSKMNEAFNTEEEFFSALVARACAVSIFLVNGVKLRGTVQSATEFCVLLKMNDSKSSLANTSLIFKSAISSVVPVAFSEDAGTGKKVARADREIA